MKKLCLVFLIALAVFNTCKAQYVTIPDTTFVNWLKSNGYAACFSGNQLDTTCGAVLSATTMSCSAVPIRDLTGVQYFKNLDSLDCSNDALSLIPALPPSLTRLNCSTNNLNSLPTLPVSLLTLMCYGDQLSSLPVLPSTLQFLQCSGNQISSLPALPFSLQTLWCYDNLLSSLPVLPATLQNLECYLNRLTSLPSLPSSLLSLNCETNYISSLPLLPQTMQGLECSGNRLTNLPALPLTLTGLGCVSNQLTSLPVLPPNLMTLECSANLLTTLPSLPLSLQVLSCYTNQLTTLPTLPPVLGSLDCSNNQITALPDLTNLSNSSWVLNCSYNPLTALPPLPYVMQYLNCSYDTNLSCLPVLTTIANLNFSNTQVTCLPNYGTISSSIPSLDSIPLCGIFNPHGCPVFWNISGQCFYDENSDCLFDSIDVGTNYVKTQLYNGTTLVQQTFTDGEGFYSFDSVANGSYTVQVDTSNLPFVVSCPDSDYYSVTLSVVDTLSYSNNFAFRCRTVGFDVGVESVLNNYVTPRPNATFALNTIAGDMSELYGAHCASGISGQVQIVYSGQVNYVGPAFGAIAPTTVSGDTITWGIADYGAVNDFTAFNLLFKVDSLATPGGLLCFDFVITPIIGDYTVSNNTLSYCFAVVNALDPNEKEVYPQGIIDSANEWLTYTIRFQNTGTAPAVNVRITDTLDSSLDPSTFQLLAYSAKNLTQIFGNDVVFNFPNINLPDSATSDSASRGYIQYKIKMKNSVPVRAEINNTAYIYFDLNSAVVTNTTTNIYGDTTTGIRNLGADGFVTLYPNPAHDYTTVSVSDDLIGSRLELSDAVGRSILRRQITSAKFNLPTGGLSKGIYSVRVFESGGAGVVKKLVVE